MCARTLVTSLLCVTAALRVQAAPVDRTPAISFFEARVQQDPNDVVAQNGLADLCLTKLWQTGDLMWLQRARKAATASLASVPASRNLGGLTALTRVEYESHHFAAARDLALQLTKLEPNSSHAFALLGDGLLEFGEVDRAAEAYAQMERRSDDAFETHTRAARLAFARGQLDDAATHYADAIEAARALSSPRSDIVAWALVQHGQLALARGDWATAEGDYTAALQTEPDEPHALEHLAELRAAQENYAEAISLAQRAIDLTPRLEFLQMLGDIYAAAGRMPEAKQWHERARDAFLQNAEQGNAHYFHHLAGYYADTEENAAEALKWARRDLEFRHTAAAHDALAWALYRGGDFANAANESNSALQSGTQDAHILFHAGMILLAAGDARKGRDMLDNAARVNPRHMSFHVHR